MCKIKHIYTAFISAILILSITSCGKGWRSYQGIEYDDNIPNISITPADNLVPIMVSMNNPYFIITTKGQGVIEQYDKTDEEVKEKWDNAKFYVYAFLTNNSEYGGGSDFTTLRNEEALNFRGHGTPYCLISDSDSKHGKSGHIKDGEFIEWDNGEQAFYSGAYQNYKYNFFAYYVDDAIDDSRDDMVHREKDRIVYDVKIDGSQDLIYDVATPSENTINQINKDDQQWMFTGGKFNLFYSTQTGHRNVFPEFKMRHALSKFNFILKGGDKSSQYVTITRFFLKSNVKGQFTVAAADTTTLGVVFPDSEEKEFVYLKGIENGVTVDNGEIKTLENSLLLPPNVLEYPLYIDCTFDDPNDEDPPVKYNIEYKLRFNGAEFEAGTSYNVMINVFGMQKVKIQVGLNEWNQGGTIEIDNEDSDDDKIITPK